MGTVLGVMIARWAAHDTAKTGIRYPANRRPHRTFKSIATAKEDATMRLMTMTAISLLVAAPIMSVGVQARADNNDWVGRAQQFMNGHANDSDRDRDRDAYERGRQDEMRHQQAEQNRYRYRHNDDDRD
jgi:hypothetical protein